MNKKTVRILVPAIFGLTLVCLWLTAIQPARAATITVDTPSDELDYDCSVGNCSLRDAIALAAADDTIVFDPALEGQIISLTLGSPLDIDKNLIIDGSSLIAPVKVSGDNTTRVFNIVYGVNVQLIHLDILHGAPGAGFGGGIYNVGNLTIEASNIYSNSTPQNGGGIYNGGTLTLYDSTLADNSADYGGGIRNDGDLTVDNTHFNRNSADWGGGIDNYYGSLYVSNGTFYSNTALYEGGGIISGAPLTVTYSAFDQNMAGSGGGVFLHNLSTASIDNTDFTGNIALWNGGAIINIDATVDLDTCSLVDNSADYGGGIRNDGILTVYATYISRNSANWGGGIDNYAGSLFVDSSTFYSNTAEYEGGGIISGAPLFVTYSTFDQNMAGSGGGVFLHNSSTASIDYTDFTSNIALWNGGAIFNSSATVDLDTCSLLDNSAYSGGGIRNEGALTVSGCSLIGNKAAEDGGGILNHSSATLLVTGSTLSGNSASSAGGGYGGGIENYGVLNLISSTLTSNSARFNGGGLENWGGTLTVTNTDFISNSANAGGGIVNNTASTLEMSDSTFRDNTANMGGGIYNDNNSALQVINSAFYSNTGVNGGGGLYQLSGTASITGSTFISNSSAYGGAIRNEAALTVTLSTLRSNSAEFGAGIHNIASGDLQLERSTIASNSSLYQGGGVYNGALLTVTYSTFAENTSSAGGGIYNALSLAVGDSTFYSNTAAGAGGGIINYGSGTLTLENNTFSNNAAWSGGGIANANTLSYRNNLIANSRSGGDCVNTATISDNLNNLVEDGGCSAALSGDPSLGTLAGNSGSTQTCALMPDSPAIDAGDNATCLASDQRGQPRDDWTCDIGAFELQFADSPSVSKAISGVGIYTFGPTKVKIELLTPGALTNLSITKIEADHPGHTGSAGGNGVGWGEYFSLTPNPGANNTFTATLTLPTLFTPDSLDTVCRFISGTLWDCAAHAFSTTPFNNVSRDDVNSFSEWATGNHVGPTKIGLTTLRATSGRMGGSLAARLAFLAVASALLIWWLLRVLKTRRSDPKDFQNH